MGLNYLYKKIFLLAIVLFVAGAISLNFVGARVLSSLLVSMFLFGIAFENYRIWKVEEIMQKSMSESYGRKPDTGKKV